MNYFVCLLGSVFIISTIKFDLILILELKERVEHVVVPSSPTRDSEFLECQVL